MLFTTMHGGMKKDNRHKLKNRWIPTYKGVLLGFFVLGGGGVTVRTMRCWNKLFRGCTVSILRGFQGPGLIT